MSESLPPPYRRVLPDHEGLSPQERALLEYHRDSLMGRNGARPMINPDKSTTTILMTGVKGPDGRIYNVPSYDNREGKIIEDPYAFWAKDIAAGRFPGYEDKAPNGNMEMHPANVAARRFHTFVDKDMEAYKATKQLPWKAYQ